ncbi:MAG TPA: ABC transporter substrate-binding protein, partial [Roseomonas sp.]
LAVAPTAERRRELADQLQAAFHDNVNYLLGGQFSAPPAWRADLTGVLPFPIPVFWNVSRRGN